MTKDQYLDLLMLLSAVESWSLQRDHRMPDYLYVKLDATVDLVRKEILK